MLSAENGSYLKKSAQILRYFKTNPLAAISRLQPPVFKKTFRLKKTNPAHRINFKQYHHLQTLRFQKTKPCTLTTAKPPSSRFKQLSKFPGLQLCKVG